MCYYLNVQFKGKRVNKPLLLHPVGCLYYCISDARSYKHQIRVRFTLILRRVTEGLGYFILVFIDRLL